MEDKLSMKRKLSLKNEDRGASLLAVLIVLVVVSAIAVVITKVTLTNVQMKEVERGTKRNFYSAESVMDELYAGACEISAEAMKTAYVDVMENYLTYTKQGKNLQKIFEKNYMTELENTLTESTVTPQIKQNAAGETEYSISQYDPEKLRVRIATAADRPYFITKAADDPTYDADYKEATMTLHKIKVAYTDAQGYETTISTDLVFTTPKLTFSGDNSKEFMKYSLIADRMISVNFPNIKVGGNVYAGEDGIVSKASASGSFDGKVILTRGDIVTQSASALNIGNSGSNIWAENIRTEGNGASSLSLKGNCYVADDLNLNGKSSTVKIEGNYYGYNFQKNYATPQTALDSAFSSAMMVNARDCKLDLQDISYLMLAGKTFISRGSSGLNNDVMLGESLSVRTNQLAYYVPAKYVDGSGRKFTSTGLRKYSQSVGISNVEDYLDPVQQVVPYYYRNRGVSSVYYYLNFASEQKANDYFALYSNGAKSTSVNGYADNYLSDDAIILDDNRIFTLKGDIMYRSRRGNALQTEQVTIDSTDWSTSGVYWDYVSSLAVKYKSLQLDLNESYTGVTADNVRLTDDNTAGGNIDKSVSPMFEHLIDQAALEAEVDAKGSVDAAGNTVYIPVDGLAEDHAHHQSVILVHNGSGTYSVPTLYSEGIIVATGDVCVQQEFKGLIISGGTISFLTNVNVDSNKILVTKLFADDIARDDPLFSKFFRDFTGGSSAEKALETVDLKSFLNYENWKKN